MLHIKRFYYKSYSRDKIDGKHGNVIVLFFFLHLANIDFPITGLDMSSVLSDLKGRDEPALYDLYGISNHVGGLGGGHYGNYNITF